MRYAPGSIIRKHFATVNAVGAPTTLLGSPVVSIYKNALAAESVSGVTLTVDFDGIVGLNLLVIDTSTDVGFYDAGDFDAVITTGTVDGTSVIGYPVFHFNLDAALATAAAIADVQARLPAALINGKMDSSIEGVKGQTLNANKPYTVPT